jgi:hypothetical protein
LPRWWRGKEEEVVEGINDMPAGTIGFRASGKLTPEDYRDVLVPTLREAVEAGEVRMLFVLSDFEELEPRAWLEDAKTGLELGFLKHSAWKRSAIVSDAEWVKKAFRMFAWMTPGEVAVYDLDQEAEARDWVASG